MARGHVVGERGGGAHHCSFTEAHLVEVGVRVRVGVGVGFGVGVGIRVGVGVRASARATAHRRHGRHCSRLGLHERQNTKGDGDDGRATDCGRLAAESVGEATTDGATHLVGVRVRVRVRVGVGVGLGLGLGCGLDGPTHHAEYRHGSVECTWLGLELGLGVGLGVG